MSNREDNKQSAFKGVKATVTIVETDTRTGAETEHLHLTLEAAKKIWLWLLPCVALFVLATFAHYKVAAAGENYKGMLAPLDRVFDLLLALGVVSAVFCAGRWLSRKLALEFTSLAEELAISILLGTGIVGMVIFAMGICGLFKPWAMALLFVLIFVVAYREAARLIAALAEGVKRNLLAQWDPLESTCRHASLSIL